MTDLDIPKEWFRFSSDDLSVATHCFEDMYPLWRRSQIPQ
jgi:hypothetical protein